jgi:hypothetical protein
MASTPTSTDSNPRRLIDISEEADKALRPWVMVGLPLTLALCFLIPMGVIWLGALFPHNPMIAGQHSLLSMLSYFVWMIPAYWLFSKIYQKRLDFGRKYVAEKKWQEAEAALSSFDSFGQKFFDRTGEAHYLLSFALDGLGKRNAAEKARKFVRENRSRSEFASMLGTPKETVIVSASELRKRDTTDSDNDTSAGSS